MIKADRVILRDLSSENFITSKERANDLTENRYTQRSESND